MPHAFVSYVRENQGIVDRLCAELHASGAKIWLDREQIDPGTRWKAAIRSAIENGAFFLACFSVEYLERNRSYMNEELELALDELRRRPRGRAFFIPIKLSDAAIPAIEISARETLNDLQWVDLSSEWNDGIAKILDVITPTDKKYAFQSEPDAKALNLVYRQLTPDADAEPVSQHELNDAISGASALVRAQIFHQAWRMRHDNWRKNKPLMERSIPVFRGLMHSDVDRHQNFGQLGFALKDRNNPDWAEAETTLTSAINTRGPVTENAGWGFYEFNRAICRIMTDAGFSTGAATAKTRKMQILADLRAAKHDGLEQFIQREDVLQEWMKLNKISSLT